MGQDFVDPTVVIGSCGDEPQEVTIRLKAEQVSPVIDLDEVITNMQYRQLLDAATSFATFESVAKDVITDFWDALPQTSSNEGKSALYACFRTAREAAAVVLC